MKFTSVAIVAAFLCIAVVSAAPSTSPNAAFEDLTFNVLDKIKQKVQEVKDKIKCAHDVIEKEVADSELKADFEQYKSTVDKLLGDLKNCSSEENKLDVVKCSLNIIKALGQETSAFLNTVHETNKELAATIRKQIEKKCNKKSESFESAEIDLFFDADEEEMDLKDSKVWKFLMKLKCQTRAIQAACKGTKFEVIFDEHRDAMWEVEDKLKECMKENKLERVPCAAKALKKAAMSFGPFFQKLGKLYHEAKEDKELGDRIAAELEKCNV